MFHCFIICLFIWQYISLKLAFCETIELFAFLQYRDKLIRQQCVYHTMFQLTYINRYVGKFYLQKCHYANSKCAHLCFKRENCIGIIHFWQRCLVFKDGIGIKNNWKKYFFSSSPSNQQTIFFNNSDVQIESGI